MVESDECPLLKSNKMNLVETAALACSLTHSLTHHVSSSLSPVLPFSLPASLHHILPVAHPPAGFQISRLFVADQCPVINRGDTLLFFINGMPPTWVSCLSEPVLQLWIGFTRAFGDQQRQTTQLSVVVSIVHDHFKFAAFYTDCCKCFDVQQHECNTPALNYIHTRFVLDSSVAAWQWRWTVLT